MRVQTFYRLTVWMPLLVPALVALAIHGVGLRPGPPFDKVAQVLLASLLYGGLPYAGIAMWGTFWIDNRSEDAIRRQAFRTPMWMVVAYAPLPAVIGVRSGDAGMALAVFVLGALMIMALGYAYVLVVLVTRRVVFGSFEPGP